MMAQRGGQGGFGGGSGTQGGFGGQRAGGGQGGAGTGVAGQQGVAVLWTIDANGKPAPVRVRTGLTDGQVTEIVDGPSVKEGLKVIAAVTNEKAASGSNPFQQQQQQGGPGRRVL
jgi:hypothetical protein